MQQKNIIRKLSTTLCLLFLNNLFLVVSAKSSIRGSENIETDYIIATRALQEVDLPPLSHKVLKNTYGEGWNVWDKQHIIKGLAFKCSWTNYRYGDKSLPMCVHSEDDTVSTAVKSHGYWNECVDIYNLWSSQNGNDSDIFVDIGANIGSCVMHFLMHTNANIIAFEPNPRNLFCLTSTLSNLDYKYQKRVTLFPIGLGSSPSTSIIFGVKGNLGHSSISLDINERRGGRFHHGDLIHVERLDNILNSEELSGNNIRVMKIDVEGFECHVLDGMGTEILSHVDKIHTEVSAGDLEQHGCSSTEYIQKLQNANFQPTLRASYGEAMQTYVATSNRLIQV